MTTEQVIEHLEATGQQAMADFVLRLSMERQSLQQAADRNLKAYYDLKDRYEPQPSRSASCWQSHWTGD